jgi:CRISPR-associated endonuclease/helicase Cas3
MWDRLPTDARQLAIEFFSDEKSARTSTILLAALHDIGKVNRFFQQKDPRQISRLSHLGIVTSVETASHGEATQYIVANWLKDLGWDVKSANGISIAIGGHHGKFRPNFQRASVLELTAGYAPGAITAIFQELTNVLGHLTLIANSPKLSPFLGWLAGFVSVADWLGSNEKMVVWSQHHIDLQLYYQEAIHRATQLLDSIDWLSITPSTKVAIESFLPTNCKPNSLQLQSQLISNQDFEFAIIEAPTGEGKTESAFALCENSRSAGAGIFFALPTMATANGLYHRVHSYLETSNENQTITKLLHSQSWLYKDELMRVNNPNDEESNQPDEDWFSGSKRGLLALYGVGTIDQSLVGALRAKHGFVRLFALAGKTVVVDEVHAYDVYMSDLLARLISWLKHLNCRVVLLSATLPPSKKEALLAAWGITGSNTESNYPCVTWVRNGTELQTQKVSVQSRKPVTFSLLPQITDTSWQTGADHIANLVTYHGGTGALILNTVREAQDAFTYLSHLLQSDIDLVLFHARFTLSDRANVENKVLGLFGKTGVRNQKRILVATQVVEQSLDLDFDHMVSALAPIDLIIQRAGRLHRHKRDRNGVLVAHHQQDARPNPTLYILEPQISMSGVPELKDPVYAHDILLKTHDFLQQQFSINKPEDVAHAVDTVYSSTEINHDRMEWQQKLEAAFAKNHKIAETHHQLASDIMICPPNDPIQLITGKTTGFDESDESPGSQVAAQTRLESQPSASLIILQDQNHWPPTSFTKETKRKLALNTVRTTANGTLLKELLDLPKPHNWEKSGSNKYSIPILLNSEGFFETESYHLSYNPQTGLRIKKKNAHL